MSNNFRISFNNLTTQHKKSKINFSAIKAANTIQNFNNTLSSRKEDLITDNYKSTENGNLHTSNAEILESKLFQKTIKPKLALG